MQLLARRVRALAPGHPGRRLLASTFWSVVAESASRGLLLLALVFVARSLGTSAYGEFGIIRSTINVFATLGGLGLGLTANRFVAQYRDTDKTFSGRIVGSSYVLAILSGSMVGLAVFIGAGRLASEVLRAEQLRSGLQLAALLLLLGAVQGAQIGVLQGLEAYRRLAIGSFVQGAIALLVLVVGAHYYGLNGALGGLVAYSGVGVVIFHAFIRNELRRQSIAVRYGDFAATLPIFWRFSLPVVLAGVAIAPIKWLAETLLVRRLGFAELGFFHASLTVSTMLIAVVSTLNAPLISLAANNKTGGAQDTTYVTLYGSYFAFLAIATPLVVFPGLTSLVFGAEYATAKFHAVSVLLLLYCALMTYYQGILRLIVLDGSMWFGFATNLFEGAALIIGFLFLMDRGAPGLAIAYVLSYVVRVAISLPHLIRRGIVSRRLLLDRFFLVSLVAFAMLVFLQVRALQ